MAKNLVVINYFNIIRAFSSPYKAHAPLFVDANAVLPLTVARQEFKMVAGWRFKKLQCRRGSQLRQLALRYFSDIGKTSGLAGFKEGLGVCALERLDHEHVFYTACR